MAPRASLEVSRLGAKGFQFWVLFGAPHVASRVFRCFLGLFLPGALAGGTRVPKIKAPQRGSSMMRREFDAGKGSSCRKGKFYYEENSLVFCEKGVIMRKKFRYEKNLV